MWRSLWSNSWLVSTLVVRGNRAGGYSEHLLFYYPYYLSLLYLFSRQQPPSLLVLGVHHPDLLPRGLHDPGHRHVSNV